MVLYRARSHHRPEPDFAAVWLTKRCGGGTPGAATATHDDQTAAAARLSGQRDATGIWQVRIDDHHMVVAARQRGAGLSGRADRVHRALLCRHLHEELPD